MMTEIKMYEIFIVFLVCNDYGICYKNSALQQIIK